MTATIPVGSIVVMYENADMNRVFAIVQTLGPSESRDPREVRARSRTLWHAWPKIETWYTDTFVFHYYRILWQPTT